MANSALCRQLEANTAFPMSLTEMVLITDVFCKWSCSPKQLLPLQLERTDIDSCVLH